MTEAVFTGGTDPLVEDLGDGKHVPYVKLMGEIQVNAAAESWVDVEYETDPQGRVVREKQKNSATGAMREHTITYTTASNGNAVTLIGDWV